MALTDKLTAIADAIRNKLGTTDTMTLDEMPDKIGGIETGSSVGFSQVTATSSSVIQDCTFFDSAGELVTGTMPTRSDADINSADNGIGSITIGISEGYYPETGYNVSYDPGWSPEAITTTWMSDDFKNAGKGCLFWLGTTTDIEGWPIGIRVTINGQNSPMAFGSLRYDSSTKNTRLLCTAYTDALGLMILRVLFDENFANATVEQAEMNGIDMKSSINESLNVMLFTVIPNS